VLCGFISIYQYKCQIRNLFENIIVALIIEDAYCRPCSRTIRNRISQIRSRKYSEHQFFFISSSLSEAFVFLFPQGFANYIGVGKIKKKGKNKNKNEKVIHVPVIVLAQL